MVPTQQPQQPTGARRLHAHAHDLAELASDIASTGCALAALAAEQHQQPQQPTGLPDVDLICRRWALAWIDVASAQSAAARAALESHRPADGLTTELAGRLLDGVRASLTEAVRLLR